MCLQGSHLAYKTMQGRQLPKCFMKGTTRGAEFFSS